MIYSFDNYLERRGSKSAKWDDLEEQFGVDD